MITKKEPRTAEYKCTYCGKVVHRGINTGRPDPGTCPRKKNGGPHSWAINRKY